MKTFRISTILLMTLVLLFVNVATVLAVPPLPSSFYGTVKANGANVPGCIQVSARINGVQYALSHYLLYGEMIPSIFWTFLAMIRKQPE